MEIFDLEIDVDSYAEKLEDLHEEARSNDLHHKEVIESAEESLSEEEFTVFQCALLRGNIANGQTLDDLAHNVKRMRQKRKEKGEQ